MQKKTQTDYNLDIELCDLCRENKPSKFIKTGNKKDPKKYICETCYNKSQPIINNTSRQKRNSACLCNSGLKYKKCCALIKEKEGRCIVK